MRNNFLLLFCLSALLCLNAQNPYKHYTDNLPFKMAEVKAPTIPDIKVSLPDFGADPTGTTLCTDAFAKAIDQLYKMGGGHLVVPRGVWYTGPVVLRSNIDLHLEAGAVIQFAADETLYPLVNTSFEGLDTRRCQSPLSANGATNISITGQGVIDGKEVTIIEDFTAMRKAVFATNLADGATASSTAVRGGYTQGYGAQHLLDGDYDTYFATDDNVKTADIDIVLDGSKTFNRVLLQEYIPLGQRVESFTIQYRKNGTWTDWKSGTTIGHKRILLGNSVTADAVRIRITSSLACPVLNGFGLYNDTVSGL